MNECRYHAVEDSVYFQGILRVRCYNGKKSPFEDLNEDCLMAKDIAKQLNYWLEILEDSKPKKGVK